MSERQDTLLEIAQICDRQAMAWKNHITKLQAEPEDERDNDYEMDLDMSIGREATFEEMAELLRALASGKEVKW
jgi:hypothetical protein